MNNIKKDIEAFRKSLENIQDDKYLDYFRSVSDILDSINNKIEDFSLNIETINENIGFMDSDLSNIQEELFEEVSLEELNDLEDKYTEFNCPHCNKPIFIEQAALENNKDIPCPYCGKNIKL